LFILFRVLIQTVTMDAVCG